MSDKSMWRELGSIMGLGQTAQPLATSTRRCEAGHPMAIDWVKCPYCEAARNAGARTRFGSGAPTRAAGGPDAETGGAETRACDETPDTRARQTRLDAGPPPATVLPAAAPGRPPAEAPPARRAARETRMVDEVEASAAVLQRRAAGGTGRRLVGLLVTFSRSPLGQLFELHEGRNYVGSGALPMEGHRPADVLLADDDRMSSAHCLVLWQNGKYRISDCNSTNGTFVNGEQVDPLGIELVDGALIQAGSTLFTFQKLLPPMVGIAPRAEPPGRE